MSFGIGSEEERLKVTPTSIPAQTGDRSDGSCVPTGFRESHLNSRKALMRGLGACFDESMVLRQILQELPIISSLPQDFQFSEALRYDPSQKSGASSPIVNELKSRISQRIKPIAAKAEELCDDLDAKARYLDRLERQFDAILSKLIEAERRGCATKVRTLCRRVDSALDNVRGGPLCNLGERFDELSRLSKSLRHYSSLYLETNAKVSPSIELLSTGPGSPSVTTPLKEFFDQFTSVIEELRNSLSEQNVD